MSHRIYTLFVLILIVFGAAILPAAAAEYDLAIKGASGACNQLTIRYSVVFDDFGVSWSLAKSDETPVEDGKFNPIANTPSGEEIVTLDSNLIPGQKYVSIPIPEGRGFSLSAYQT